MFKHILQALLMAVCLMRPTLVMGSILTADEAKDVAADFFKSAGDTRLSGDGALVLVHTESASSLPVYYVFNSTDGKGFVIVSANDGSMPVMGYSRNTTWEVNNMPGEVSGILRVNPQIRSQSVCSNRFNCYACVRHQIEVTGALVMPL